MCAAADRGYGISIGGDGSVYVAGYTRGVLSGASNLGDKDVFALRVPAAGGAPTWRRTMAILRELGWS